MTLRELLLEKIDLFENELLSDDEYYARVEEIDNYIANNYTLEEIEKEERLLEE